jgi:glycosyltransferase involved in cell wall biosynthesis
VASALGGFRADELRADGIPVLTIPIRSFFDPGPVKLSGFLADYIRQHRIRLVHVFDPGLSLVSTMAALRSSGVRLLSSQRFYMDLVPAKYRYLLLASHWLSGGVVTNSRALRDYLHRVYRYPLRRIGVCHNAVDTAQFTPEERSRIAPLTGAELVIGTVCVMRREKNLGHLVEAFARVRRVVPGVRLLMMGSGPEEPLLRTMTERLGIVEACCFLPSGQDVRSAMRSIDIFVCSSISEGLPNAVMEAMACGCCVVAPNVGGCPELMDHGVDGMLFKPVDLDDLTAQMEALARRPELCAQLGAAAAIRMQQSFSVPCSISQMEAIYEQYCPATVA